jgi:hypothetical protein
MQKAWEEEFRQTTDPLAVWLERSTVEGPEAWVAKDDPLNAYNPEGTKDGGPNLTKQAMTQPRVR